MRRRGRGLTLVEMLVAILLLSFAAALVVQGIGQGLALLRRVAADQGEVYHELMAQAWLRQTVAAATFSLAGGEGLQGDARRLRLHTFRPLLGPEGIVAGIDWEADARGVLHYLEGEQQFPLEALPPLERIEYRDGDGNWYPQWPPEDSAMLPERVRFVFAANEYLDVGVRTQRVPLLRDDELMLDDE